MNETNPRRYGCWGGQPKGHPEDIANCIESVYPSSGFPMPHQCRRKSGHGPGGLYCKQHAKRFANAKGTDE